MVDVLVHTIIPTLRKLMYDSQPRVQCDPTKIQPQSAYYTQNIAKALDDNMVRSCCLFIIHLLTYLICMGILSANSCLVRRRPEEAIG